MRRVMLVTLLGLGISAVPARAADTTITVGNTAFTPANVTINQGDVVNWDWSGPDGNHSTTTDTNQEETWDSDPNDSSPEHPPGFRFSWNFQKVGEFNYFCKVHPSTMRGKVTVIPRGQPVPIGDDVQAPQLGTVRVSLRRLLFRFNINEAATIRWKLRGRTRREKEFSAQPGKNEIKLPRMRPGRYALLMRATDAAENDSVVVRKKFTVPRR